MKNQTSPTKIELPLLTQGTTGLIIFSARSYRRTKDVRVLAVVVPELELIDVQREILTADFMECTDDATFDDGPEALDGVRVNRTAHVFIAAVMHDTERVFVPKRFVRGMFIGGQQTYLVRHDLTHERSKSDRIDVIDHSRNHVAFALDRADHNGFSCSASTTHAAASAWAFVLVPGLTADIGFVNLDIADQLLELLIAKCSADLVAHKPCGLVGTKAHVSHDLEGTYSLLAGEHQVHNPKPVAQRLVGVLEYRTRQHGKAVASIWSAVIALPVEILGAVRLGFKTATRAAYNALRPAIGGKVSLARILVRKSALEVRYAHLVDSVVRGLDLLGHDRFLSLLRTV